MYGIHGTSYYEFIGSSDIVISLGQTVIPLSYKFINKFEKAQSRIIGNKDLYLDEKEIKRLI